jgi:LacI family transcriptional regulator
VSDRSPHIDRLVAREIPIALVGPAASSPHIRSVGIDNVEGGKVAAQHLLDQGRTKLLFVGGPIDLPQIRSRIVGAQSSVSARIGASLDVLARESQTIREGRIAGELLLARAPEARPDAVFTANDLLAIGLTQSLNKDKRVRVPDEIIVVGYDDIQLSNDPGIELTTIRQPAEEMGRVAVDVVLNVHGSVAAQQLLRPQLVVRTSSGFSLR